MRLIDKLVFIDLIGPLINGLCMFLMLLFAATYLFPATELIVRGVPLITVFRLVLFNLPGLLTQTFPMAMLLSGLLGMGRLSSDREVIAIFAAGVNFPRTARAVILLGGLVSLVAFVWNDTVVPPCSAIALQIRRKAEQSFAETQQALSYPIEGKKGVQEFVTVSGGYESKTRTLRRVSIIKYSDDPQRIGQVEALVYCDRAIANSQSGVDWTYYDGYFVPFVPGEDGHSIEDYSTVNFHVLKALPHGASVGKKWDEVLKANTRDDSNAKSFRSLQKEIERDRKNHLETGGKEVDLYGKIALPLASLIFGIVGAALGLSTQRGAGKTVGFGMAIFIVFLYWIFYHSMFVVGQNGGLPPALASFLPDIAGAIVGIVLMFRASR